MMSGADVIDSMYFMLSKVWQNVLQNGYEPVKIRRGYQEIDLGEWIIRRYVWGRKVRFEVDNREEMSYIERVGDTYKSHGSWDVLQRFLVWAEDEGLV